MGREKSINQGNKEAWKLEGDICREETNVIKRGTLEFLYRLIRKDPLPNPNELYKKALTRNKNIRSPLTAEEVLELTKRSYRRWVPWVETRRWKFKGLH